MSVNKVLLISILTKDPETRYLQDGTPVCNFTVAVNEKWKDKSGKQQERAEFVNIVAWRQLAEICGKYLTKGQMVYLEGKLTTRKYQDRDGNDRYITEVVADQMQMLGGKKQGGEARDEPPFNPDSEIPF